MSHRDDLLAAARELLLERGYRNITTRDLVAASGTNLASIGYHFGSKDALLQEAVGGLMDDWAARLGAAALDEDDVAPLERLARSWRRMLEDFEQHRPLFRAAYEASAEAARTEPLRARLAAHYAVMRAAIADLVAAALGPAADEVDTVAVAGFLVAVADGLMVQHLVDPEGAPKADELLPALGAALEAAVSARTP